MIQANILDPIRQSDLMRDRKVTEISRRANILDPISAELSPRVWNHPGSPKPILKPVHAHWIKTEIYKVLDNAGYTNVEDWLTLVFTGSLTTYQYSDSSDIDVSLFVDSSRFPEWSRAEMIGLMIDHMDGRILPGTPFPMQDFVVPEGVKPHDLYKPGLRSGYNIDNNKWIVPPEHERVYDVKAQENGFYIYALQMADKMEALLRYEPDKAVTFWHQIHKRRGRDMKAGKGDAAESNIVYKMLAQRGLFPQISEVSGEYIAATGAIMSNDGLQDQIWDVRQGALGQASQGDEETPVEPTFPSLDDAVEANRESLAAVGELHPALIRPDVLESALGRAQNQWHYTQSMANAAAALAHGVAQAQAFENGNKRTAYWLTHQFLHENGYGHLAPDDDEELANHILGYGEHTHGLEDTVNMFHGRGHISKTAAGDWFAPSYMIPQETKEQLAWYASGLPWPDEHNRSPWERYHVTGLYSPSGFSDPEHQAWVQSKSGVTYPVQIIGLESFGAGEKGHPVVLRVHHPGLQEHTERLQDEAEARGIPVSRHPGGYKPHITLGYSATPIEADHPHMTFPVGPLRDLHTYYDEQRQASIKMADKPTPPPHLRNKDELSPDKDAKFEEGFEVGKSHCGNCKMFFDGKCSGYAKLNAKGEMESYPVKVDEVCDSWYPGKKTAAASSLAQQIYQRTLESGGTTLNLVGQEPTTRYGFAPEKTSEERIPVPEFTAESVRNFIAKHQAELADPGKFIGTWIEHGDVFLDITEGHDEYDEAFKRAWNGHQQALWDNVAQQAIPVRGFDYEPVIGDGALG